MPDFTTIDDTLEELAVEAADRADGPLRCYSASGTAYTLRAIANRGGLIDGDVHAICAAVAIIEDGIRRGVL